MNERLERLKKQAVNYAEEVFDYNGKDYREIVMEKFAELIVGECADIAVHNQSGWEAGMKIKEHFGVEE